jgi:hypothetical protein
MKPWAEVGELGAKGALDLWHQRDPDVARSAGRLAKGGPDQSIAKTSGARHSVNTRTRVKLVGFALPLLPIAVFALKRFPTDLNRWDSQEITDGGVFGH